MTSAPAIGFEYRPSRLLARARWVVAGLALLAIALCGLGLLAKVLLAIMVVTVFEGSRRRGRRTAVVAAGLSQEGGWSLRYADGSDATARLRAFRMLGTLVLVQLAVDGRRQREALLLGPDNSEADIRRRLRMRLNGMRLSDTGVDGTGRRTDRDA